MLEGATGAKLLPSTSWCKLEGAHRRSSEARYETDARPRARVSAVECSVHARAANALYSMSNGLRQSQSEVGPVRRAGSEESSANRPWKLI